MVVVRCRYPWFQLMVPAFTNKREPEMYRYGVEVDEEKDATAPLWIVKVPLPCSLPFCHVKDDVTTKLPLLWTWP